MNLSPIAVIRLMFISLFVLLAGCRPTIEFEADTQDIAPGDEVELEWEVELAKGTSSSRVTVTDLGEVDIEGSGTITLDETKDVRIRVSTFVLGMPITSKQSITINVLDENFATWDFDMGSDEDWDRAYVFYEEQEENKPELGEYPDDVLCNIEDDGFDSTAGGSVSPDLGNLGDSLKLCFHNDRDKNEEKVVMPLVYRKVTDVGDFDIDNNTTYKIGMSVRYGIYFDEDECDKVTNQLESVFQLVLGASHDKPEVNTDDQILKLHLEEFEDLVDKNKDLFQDTDVDVEEGLSYPEFTIAAAQSSFIKFADIVFDKSDVDASITSDDYLKELCEKNLPLIATYSNVSEQDIVVSTDDNDDLYIFIGMKAGDLEGDDGDLDQDRVEIYIDSVRALIEEQ
ncbi:MAG: hypothetical protein MI867_15275 [Pseudomonadales bacterium]|nr:hypothetical protein [Pseudomonadales bacterium]